ncbi:hypothetical protein [Duganella hordei]
MNIIALITAAWEQFQNLLEDKELLKIAEERLNDGLAPIEVSLDDL